MCFQTSTDPSQIRQTVLFVDARLEDGSFATDNFFVVLLFWRRGLALLSRLVSMHMEHQNGFCWTC